MIGEKRYAVCRNFWDHCWRWYARTVVNVVLSKQIPELKTEPIQIGFHIAEEMATALMLIVSGILFLTGAAIGKPLDLLTSGMLFYPCIVSPGYFTQQRKWGWIVMFSALIVIGIIAVIQII